MQLRTGLIISSPSIHKYCSASSNSEPITVALQSSRVSMILNRSTEPCVDILLGSSGNLLGRYRKMKATSNEMIVRATGTFTLCASQIWTPEMEEKLCRSDAQRQAMAYGHGFTRIISPTGRSSPRWSTTRRACSPPTSTWGSSRSPSTSWTRLATTPRRGTCSFSWTRAARSPCSSSARKSAEGLSYEDIQFEVPVESRHPEGAAQVVFARHRAAPSAIPTSLGARAHQNHLDKFPNDYCHIPRELMRKYFQKVE